MEVASALTMSECREQATQLSERDIFAPRASVSRSPPVKERIASVTEADDPWQDEKMDGSPIYQLTQEEDLAHAVKKRKRGQLSPLQQRQSRLESNRESLKDVHSSLAKVVRRTKELKKLVNESTKTEVEIKQLARELAYLVDHLEKNINQYQERHDCIEETHPIETREIGTQAIAVGKSVGIHVERSDIELEKQKVEGKIRADIKEALELENGFMGLANLLDKKWPDDMYTRTRVVHPSHRELNTEGDLALLIDPA
ncbi:hypothetical protein QE152_g12596 [Popillia japonica]|uniref:Uncharacterized protein n=1 Tax=Popillia japonica TaxID=7064 RepID=A0AAW1LQT3_POPJA